MSYKFTVVINQLAAIEHFPELDIADLAICDCLIKFERAARKLHEDETWWFEASPGLIAKQLPILKLKKRAIQKRVENLVKVGILERHPQTVKLSKSWLRFTEKSLLLDFRPMQQNAQGMQQNAQHLCTEMHTPMQQNAHDKHTIDNRIRDNNKEIGGLKSTKKKIPKEMHQAADELKALFESWGVPGKKKCPYTIQKMVELDGITIDEIFEGIQLLKIRGAQKNVKGHGNFQIFSFEAFRRKFPEMHVKLKSMHQNGTLGQNQRQLKFNGVTAYGLFASLGED